MSTFYRLGLVGKDIGFSLSPRIHSAAARTLGIQCDYQIYDLKTSDVPAFIESFWALGGSGLNVTTPHKTAVAGLIQGHNLQAVNTLYRGDKAWQATSTDAAGFFRGLQRIWGNKGFSHIVFLGSGGAVVSIIEHLSMQITRLPQIAVLRRSVSHDALIQSLIRDVALLPLDPDCLERELAQRENCLLVQGTSAPLKGDDLSLYLPALSKLRGAFVDLVYKSPSALLQGAQKLRVPCQDGLPMLIEQARVAQSLWWGRAASFDELAAEFKS